MGRRMQTICNCFSAASKQAREADIDVPSKRSFRRIHASGEASSALQTGADIALEKGAARAGTGLKTFLDCLNDARYRVEENRPDGFPRKCYRKLPE